jgi:transcriptional regulator with XRE-family HTH domain
MITGSQIRAGRALLSWSAQELADRTGMSRPAIEQAETTDNLSPSEFELVRATFEKSDVLFIGHPDGSFGVMLRKRTQPEDDELS